MARQITSDRPLRWLRGLVLLLLATISLLYLRPEESFASGYSRQELSNAWTIPAGETARDWRSDDFAWSHSLPFPFPFFGATNTTIWVSSNGLISLGHSVASFSNGVAALTGVRAIAVLWDDLVTDNATGGTDIFTSQPDATHVMIRWRAVTFEDRSVVVNFETLLGSDGSIQFNYGSNTGAISATVGISDGQGGIIASDITSSDFIPSILFTAAPGKPTASFTYSPSSPRVGNIVTFNASESQDDGFIVSYNWTFGDGSPSVVEVDPVTSHAFSFAGVFNVLLTVTDNDGITGSTVQSLMVTTTGLSPVANFTATPTRALLGQPIMFNGSFSLDPDGGSIVSYRWVFGDGSDAAGPIVTHLYTNVGTYLVGLTVTDDEGAVSSFDDPVSVVVADVRLLDAYPQFKTLKLRQDPQLTLFAEAINIGNIPVHALVRFRLIDLKTGTSSVVSSTAAEMNVRDQYLFQVSYTPPAVTARYLVSATIYLSGGDLSIDSALWLASSSQAYFVIRVTR